MTDRPDTATPQAQARKEAADRHAALVTATLAAVEGLAPLSPDATPRGFEALKAAERQGGGR